MATRRVNNSRFDPFSEVWTQVQVEDEHHTIRSGLIQLKEEPDLDNYGVTVTDVSTAVAMTQVTGAPNAGEYRLDTNYGTGLIQFNTGDNDNDIDVDYYGKGSTVIARDHNWGGGGFRSGFEAGFGGDGSDGVGNISTAFEAAKTKYQYTSLTVASTVTLGAACAGRLYIGVQGRLTLEDSAYFNLAEEGAAGGLTSGAGGKGDPILGMDGFTGNIRGRVAIGTGSFAGGGGSGGNAGSAGGGGGGAGIAGAPNSAAGEEGETGGTHTTGEILSADTFWEEFLRGRDLGVGGGGGGGVGTHVSTAGDGGAGGGALYIECDELYLPDDALANPWCTVAGENGVIGANNVLGGGGGGGGGSVFILCNRIIKGSDNATTRQNYISDQITKSGGAKGAGAGGTSRAGGVGGAGFVAIIELDPTGRD